jgi:CubicO group peptidase (beta-lactamase class C family)
MTTMDENRYDRLDDAMAGFVARGDVTAAVWAVARDGDVHVGAAGVPRETIFRISSMTKPVTAVGALTLVEDCGLRLDDPVDGYLPELADRQVLADPDGPLDQTVPAHRPITLRDLLTFRLGLGMDFTRFGRQPVLDALNDLGVGVGPPAPAGAPEPDEWMRRIGTVPLERQPGERWLYHTGADVLGVLIARASGQPLEGFLRDRIFEPLGMRDTGFAVPLAAMDRFGPCHWRDPGTGERAVYDPANGQWSQPPAFPGGGAGLVSTVDDFLAFGAMLLAGGGDILSRPAVELMTTDHLSDEQKRASGPDPTGAVGWGFGVSVQVRRTDVARSAGAYGWDGGLGTSWANDSAAGLVGVLMTDTMFSSHLPPPVVSDFWTLAATS